MSIVASRDRGGAARALLAFALAAVAALLILVEADTRTLEAELARIVVDAVSPGRAVASGSIVFFGIGTPEVTGLSITTLCSTTVLIVPLLLLTVAVVGITRARPARIALGLAIGLTIAVSSNMVRFGLAAWAYSAAGREGFDLVHRYAGSLLVISGFVAAIVVLLRVSLRERRPARAARPDTPRTRRDRRRGATRPSRNTVRAPLAPSDPAAALRRDRRPRPRSGRKDR